MTDQELTTGLWLLFGTILVLFVVHAVYTRRRRNRTTHFGRLFHRNRESVTFAKKMFGDEEKRHES